MRTCIIAVGKDFGLYGQERTPDGRILLTAATLVQIRDTGRLSRFLMIDGVIFGEIVAVTIDHKDEEAP